MTDDLWYVSCEGRTIGPVPAAWLRKLAVDGEVLPDDPVWPADDPARAAPASAWPFLFSAADDPEAGWYWVRDGRTHGPVHLRHLRGLAANGQLAPEDSVARVGDADWRRAAEVEELFPALAARPPAQVDRPTSPETGLTRTVAESAEGGKPTDGAEKRADSSASRRSWRTGALAAGLSAVFWSLPLIGVSVWLGPPPWWVWLALALPAAAAGVATAARAGRVRPVRETVLANLLIAAGVGLPVAAAVGGGLPWSLAAALPHTPVACALAAPVAGAAFGAAVGLGLLVLGSFAPAGSARVLSPHERAAAVSYLAGGDPTPHLVLDGVSKAGTAVGRALVHPLLGRAYFGGTAAGAVLTVVFGAFTLIGWGWASFVLGAVAGAIASTGRVVLHSQDRLKPTPKRAFLLAVAVVGLWYVVALPIAVWAPAVFHPPRAHTPAAEPRPTTPSVPIAKPFTPAEAERVAAELDRRGVGRALLQATHPTGEFRSATPTTLSPTSAGGALLGQVEVTWLGTSGAVYRTTYTLPLTRGTADVEVRADTALFKVNAANRVAAARTLAKLSAEAQAAVHRTGPLPGK